MNCSEYENAIMDLAAGELSPDAEREVRAHLAECPSCTRTLEEIESLLAAARAELARTAPVGLLRVQDAAARDARRAAPRVPLWAAVAAVFVMAFLSGYLGYLRGRRETPRFGPPFVVVADSSPSIWKMKPEVSAATARTNHQPQCEFWDYRVRLEKVRQGTSTQAKGEST